MTYIDLDEAEKETLDRVFWDAIHQLEEVVILHQPELELYRCLGCFPLGADEKVYPTQHTPNCRLGKYLVLHEKLFPSNCRTKEARARRDAKGLILPAQSGHPDSPTF